MSYDDFQRRCQVFSGKRLPLSGLSKLHMLRPLQWVAERAMAESPPVLERYMSLSSALSKGSLGMTSPQDGQVSLCGRFRHYFRLASVAEIKAFILRSY
jgi:hypothetical protein